MVHKQHSTFCYYHFLENCDSFFHLWNLESRYSIRRCGNKIRALISNITNYNIWSLHGNNLSNNEKTHSNKIKSKNSTKLFQSYRITITTSYLQYLYDIPHLTKIINWTNIKKNWFNLILIVFAWAFVAHEWKWYCLLCCFVLWIDHSLLDSITEDNRWENWEFHQCLL